jgi:hypothetical protein
MTRTFFDAIDVNNLPPNGDGYLGYDDGNWPDADEIAGKFPGKEVIRITVNPADNKGIIGDGPPDNGTWPQWVSWVVMRRNAGEDPWINTNESNWTAGQAAFNNAGVPQPHWWIAKYDNDPTIPAGALMKQYASNSGYDTSSAVDYLPGIDPALTNTPVVSTDEEDNMAQAENGFVTLSWSEGSKHVVQAAFDTVGGNQPILRVVLFLESGPLVLADAWRPDHTAAGKVLQFPKDNIATAYGLELQPVGTPARYAACVS